MRKTNLNLFAKIFVWLFVFYCFAGCSKSGPNPGPTNTNTLTISSLSVPSGVYTTNVILTGTGFSTTTAEDKVYFNGVAASVLLASSTQIQTAVPLAAGTGSVTITVNGKTATGPIFTYQPAEVITLLASSTAFSQTVALAADGSGNVYVADQGNNLIRKITPSGLVSTFAGSGSSGSTDGTGTSASFSQPSGIAVDASGNVYVADKNTGLIRKITQAGVVTTLTVDGTGKPVGYGNPSYLVIDASANIFFTDQAGTLIRKLNPQGFVTNYYGASGSSNGFYGLALDNAGNLYTVDEFDNQIDKINTAGTLTIFAGSSNIIGGDIDGTGTQSSFYHPWGMAIDGNGNLFVLDRGNGLLRKITPAAVVTTFGGQDGANYFGPVTMSSLAGEEGIAIDASGNIYIADEQTIRKISFQ